MDNEIKSPALCFEGKQYLSVAEFRDDLEQSLVLERQKVRALRGLLDIIVIELSARGDCGNIIDNIALYLRAEAQASKAYFNDRPNRRMSPFATKVSQHKEDINEKS